MYRRLLAAFLYGKIPNGILPIGYIIANYFSYYVGEGENRHKVVYFLWDYFTQVFTPTSYRSISIWIMSDSCFSFKSLRMDCLCSPFL